MENKCKSCGSEIIGRRGHAVFCSVDCKVKAHQDKANAHLVPRPCEVCEDVFAPRRRGHKKCSIKCNWIANRPTCQNLARHGNPSTDNLKAIDIYRRDKWECQSCGVPTPVKRLLGGGRGFTDDQPSLDHIIPLSMGGTDTYANVQLLCWRCNRTKGNSSMETFMKHHMGVDWVNPHKKEGVYLPMNKGALKSLTISFTPTT